MSELAAPSGALQSADDLATALHGRYATRLVIFAFRRLRDRALAEDVAQETLRRAWEALRAGRVEKTESMAAFLFQTAQNVCLHHHRSARRRSRALEIFGRTTSESPNPSDALIATERCRIVREALDRLPPGDRQLLYDYYVDDLDAKEVAASLGVAPDTVRVRKFRALRRLEAILAETFSREGEPNTR